MAGKIDHIHYGNDAGSVPPQYYTRHELTAEPHKISVKHWQGDERGGVNITIDQSFPLSAEQFQQIVDALPGFEIRSVVRPLDKWGAPIVGGTNEWLILKAGEETLTKGGDDLEGDVRGLVQLLESFIPDEGKPKSPLME